MDSKLALEQEVRSINYLFNANKSRDNVKLFDIPKDAIQSIYLGASSDSILSQKIIDAVNKNKISAEIYKLDLANLSYSLIPTKLN